MEQWLSFRISFDIFSIYILLAAFIIVGILSGVLRTALPEWSVKIFSYAGFVGVVFAWLKLLEY
ncbi:hypothetical protein [Fictibacillus phosphorivorans]|uniref:hypothetical protein n=1 Tax=Fictibacillus phosphorivorans TaxID=1221500 RepID=UPI00203EA379|nr:hypothetical protein [Fictibacillus phosphorivorans]MCM3717622.1 hypothetical protein [Fictibacillus phosphorivorans]MCM3775522.1 hypothetical protein [Fictibacillus phosphorivorans]